MKIQDYPNKKQLDPEDLLIIQEQNRETKNIRGGDIFNVENLIKEIYPIGSIYLSVLDTNPTELFGGTWQLLAPGKTLVCIDSEDSDFSTVRKAGGEKTHTLSNNEMPSHAHSVGAHAHRLNNHTHSFTTGNQSANHTHGIPALSGSTNAAGSHNHNPYNGGYRFMASGDSSYSGMTVSGGNTRDWVFINNNGSFTVNETTSYDGSHSHTVTTKAATTSGHSANHTHSGTTNGNNGNTANSAAFNTSSVGSGKSHNNLQPYFVCYMWERTA